MIATKQVSGNPPNAQTRLPVYLSNASGDLPSNVQNKHKLVAVCPPSASKDGAPDLDLVARRFFACTGQKVMHTRAVGHRSLMTLSILFTTSLLMASSSGRGEMKLKKSIISSCKLKSKQNARDHELNIGSSTRAMISNLGLMFKKIIIIYIFF